MKKTILLSVIGLLVLTIAISMVSAAATPVKLPPYLANLTDAQKQEMAPLFNQMNDLRNQMFSTQKQIIQKQVEFGNLTQEQADQRIAWMKERMENGFGPGMMSRGPGMAGKGPGSGPRCGPGPGWQQPQTNK